MNKPSNTTNDVTNIYLRLQLFRPFYEAIIRSRLEGRMFKKLVNYNFVGSARSRYKSGITIHRYIV
jgi:hypothetical protein